MNGRSQRPARRAAAALLAVSAAALAILTAIPAVRETNLSVSRTSEIRIPKRKLAPFARQFVSTLPILDVVAENDELPGPDVAPAPAVLRVFDRSGENRLLDRPRALLPFTTVRYRGESSMIRQFRQHSIRLQILNGKRKPSRFDLCGLPADDDFALVANYMDKSLIRDRLAYELAAPLLPGTPRGRYAEVFLRKAGAQLDEFTYQGVFLVVQKISAGADRVPVGRLEMAPPDGLRGGGWIIQGDESSGTNRPSFWLDGGLYSLASPGARDATPEAVAWIRDDFSRFYDVLKADPPDARLFEMVDVESFVRLMLLQELVKNNDAFRWSAYYHRAAGGKLAAGPPWDFNLSLGNSPLRGGPEGFLLPHFPVAGWLLRDPRVFALFRERWRELRLPGAAFSDERIRALVAELAAELGPAADHHFRKYPELLDPSCRYPLTARYEARTFDQHVRIVRDFLLKRAHWLDGALAAAQEPDDLTSPEMEQVVADSRAHGVDWWVEADSPPLQGAPR